MDAMTYEDDTLIGHIHWWIYAIVIATIFGFVLVLNYIVKKINEARFDNRITRLHSKASANQTTPIQNLPDQNKVQVPIKINTIEDITKIDSSPKKGISLVFNKEENLLENKRMKADVADENNTISIDGITDSSQDYISSMSVSGKSVVSNPPEEIKPVFLGKIYEKRLKPNESKIIIQLPEAVRPSNEMTERLQDIIDKEITRTNSCDVVVRLGQSTELVTIDQSLSLSKENSTSKHDINECVNSPIKNENSRRTDHDSILNEIVEKVLQKKKESLDAKLQISYCQLNRKASESPSVAIKHEGGNILNENVKNVLDKKNNLADATPQKSYCQLNRKASELPSIPVTDENIPNERKEKVLQEKKESPDATPQKSKCQLNRKASELPSVPKTHENIPNEIVEKVLQKKKESPDATPQKSKCQLNRQASELPSIPVTDENIPNERKEKVLQKKKESPDATPQKSKCQLNRKASELPSVPKTHENIPNEIVEKVLQKKNESLDATPQKSYCQLNRNAYELPTVPITHEDGNIPTEIVEKVLQKKNESADATPQKSNSQLNRKASELPSVPVTHIEESKPSVSKK